MFNVMSWFNLRPYKAIKLSICSRWLGRCVKELSKRALNTDILHWADLKEKRIAASHSVCGLWVESNHCLLLCVLHAWGCIMFLKHGRERLSPASSSAPWTAEVQRQSAELSSRLYRLLHSASAVKLCLLHSYLIDSLHFTFNSLEELQGLFWHISQSFYWQQSPPNFMYFLTVSTLQKGSLK